MYLHNIITNVLGIASIILVICVCIVSVELVIAVTKLLI